MSAKPKKKSRAKKAKPPVVVDEMAKYRKRFVWDSKKKQLVEVKQAPRTYGVTKWPIHSSAMGVNPSQRQQLQDYLANQGVNCEVDREGRPVLTCPSHRKAVAEARGFFDRNGGYSDPQRR